MFDISFKDKEGCERIVFLPNITQRARNEVGF